MKHTPSAAKVLLRTVELFLKKHHKPGRPVLLGFSGGHDSRALWELLALSQKRHGLNLLVAHVDHGWREESAREALELKKIVEDRGFPFHLHKLEPSKSAPQRENLEEKCREERYAFFQRIYQENGCQALLLGHQADDQVETVLKRLFEGAHFTSLGAMSSFSIWEGMNVWRPLLESTREEILRFMKEKKLIPLDDRTNYDPVFLRPRMRTNLIPVLERAFGKSLRGNIREFAKSFQELRAYFLEKSCPYFAKREKIEGGALLDFSSLSSLSPIEMEVALKLFLQEEGVIVGTRHLKQLVRQLISGASNKRLLLQKRLLIVNQRKLLVYTS